MASQFDPMTDRDARSIRQSPYLVEALFLLTILATATAVFMSLFSLAVRRGDESARLDDATHIAMSVAERFCADPTAVAEEFAEEGYLVRCTVEGEATDAGVLYRATIEVFDDGTRAMAVYDAAEPLVSVDTARYVSGGA